MATNRKRAKNSPLSVTVSSPTVSGDPVVLGSMGGGVALTDYDASTGKATVDFEGVYDLEVVATNDSGNSAVAAGDEIFYAAGVLSKDSSGVFFGWALETITSGSTDTIMIRLGQSAGAGSSLSAPFMSAEVTGNGSAQSTAHGLGVAPARVAIVLTEFASNLNVDVAEGTHTTTNVVVTVTNGAKYKILAWK